MAHIDTFIEGMAMKEPPYYELVNGKVCPSYIPVTLKPSANSFDVGMWYSPTKIMSSAGFISLWRRAVSRCTTPSPYYR